MPPHLSAVLIVHNEAAHLGSCLASLAGVADEIVVLDDGSTDDTVAIARAAGARVATRPFDNFGAQKQAALDLATGDWILSLDADERLTPALVQEIAAVTREAGAADGYWIRRRLLYLGRPLRWGGTGADWVLRLARRARARFSPKALHEHLAVSGPLRRLAAPMDHIKYGALAEHIAIINRYTDVIAHEKRARGARFHVWHLLRIPAELLRRLVFQLGVLDGRAGIIHAAMAAFYGFLKYAKLWRREDS